MDFDGALSDVWCACPRFYHGGVPTSAYGCPVHYPAPIVDAWRAFTKGMPRRMRLWVPDQSFDRLWVAMSCDPRCNPHINLDWSERVRIDLRQVTILPKRARFFTLAPEARALPAIHEPASPVDRLATGL